MNNKNVCIIGLGYVGLTLATYMATKGYRVFGIETNEKILNNLKNKKAHFFEPNLNILLQDLIGQNFTFSKVIPEEEFDAFIITVGTPVDKNTKMPIMKFIEMAAKQVAERITEKSTVILRSTVAVGTSRNIILPILKSVRNDIKLAFCPERTVEGKALKELKILPQIIGGINLDSVYAAEGIFRKLTSTIVKVSSIELAEMAKLTDNCYRDVKFAFANEIGLACKELRLDSSELIYAVNHGYPRTEIPTPGFVGGACLSKDPYIFVNSLKEKNKSSFLTFHGRQINENLPLEILKEAIDELSEMNIDLIEAKIFISGFAFKGQPETDDMRDSSTLLLLDKLQKRKQTNIYGHDFVVESSSIENLGIKTCSLEDGFSGASLVIIMNNHKKYSDINIKELTSKMKNGGLFYDCWQIHSKDSISNNIKYSGIGI